MSYLSVNRHNPLRLQLLQLEEHDLPSTTPPCTPIAKTPTPVFRKGPNDARVYQPEGHPKQAVIDGEIWPPIFVPDNVRTAKEMKPRDSDVFICTYPKCGTTWLQHIVHQLVKREQYQPGEGKEMCVQSPMIERMGAKFSDAILPPRILKTHFNLMNVPKSDKAKYIFCVRNPKDCLVSYFHHNRNFKIYNFAGGEFDVFFELFISGQLAFGDYFDHLLGWLPYINNENVLFLTYEEMYNDLHTAVYRIGNFLGGEAAQIVEDIDQLQTIVESSHIDAMKKDQKRWFPENIFFRHKDEFIRKGGSRDWKNYLTKEQSDRMDTVYRTRCAGTIAQNWWQWEMGWDTMESVEAEMEKCSLQEDTDSDYSSLNEKESEEEEEEEEEEEVESVSRRNSFCQNNTLHNNVEKETTVAETVRVVRRASFNSLSTGYGSIW